MNKHLQRLTLVVAVSFPCLVSAKNYPVRRSVPFKVGDSWRTHIREVKETKGTVGNATKERKVKQTETTTVKAIVTVKQVDELGFATVWTARIQEFWRRTPRGRGRLLKKGDTIRFRRRGTELIFTYDKGGTVAQPGDEIRKYLGLPTNQDDAPLEPQRPQSLGGKWQGDVKAMRANLIANGPPQLQKHPDVFVIEAAGRLGRKLLSRKEFRGKSALEINLQTKTRITKSLEQPTQYLDKANSIIDEQILMPIGYASDFLSKRTVQTEEIRTLGKGRVPSLNLTILTTTTERRTYLEFAGGGVRPWRVLKTFKDGKSLSHSLLTGLSFDKSSVSGKGKNQRVRSLGQSAGSRRIRFGGFVTGVAGEAMKFDGRDDHINLDGIQHTLRRGTEAFTVSVWLKTKKKKTQFVFDSGFFADASLSFVITGNEGRFVVPPTSGGLIVTFPLQPAKWTHVLLTWNGREQNAYVNGALAASRKTTKFAPLTTKALGKSAFLVGTQSKKAKRKARYFSGLLDEFAVWRRELTQDEIRLVYSLGKGGKSIFK